MGTGGNFCLARQPSRPEGNGRSLGGVTWELGRGGSWPQKGRAEASFVRLPQLVADAYGGSKAPGEGQGLSSRSPSRVEQHPTGKGWVSRYWGREKVGIQGFISPPCASACAPSVQLQLLPGQVNRPFPLLDVICMFPSLPAGS